MKNTKFIKLFILFFAFFFPLELLISKTSKTVSKISTSGVRAARVIFKTRSNLGSFETSNSINSNGGNLRVKTFFSVSNDEISKPSWIEKVEIGISGSNNTNATSSFCANFSDGSSSQCDFNGDGTYDVPCNGPSDFYRISEFDCKNTTQVGNGSQSDGVYIRTVFNRNNSALKSYENIMVVLEYSSSGLRNERSRPVVECFTNGVFNPSNSDCSDMSWGVYLKTSSTANNPAIFQYLVPPIFKKANKALNLGGSNVVTKQFILPISGNQNYSTFQMSRINATEDFSFKSGSNDVCVSNSPLCVGLVFYTMTFYRI